MVFADVMVTQLLITFAVSLAVAVACVFLVFLISIPTRNVSFIDAYWGPGFALITGVAMWRATIEDVPTPRSLLLLALVTLWATRLGLYLLSRSWGEPEDRRYAAMRKKVGTERFILKSFFTVFLLQAVLQCFIALPLQVAQSIPGDHAFGPLDVAGVVLFAIGFLFESVGDWQLARFLRDPANKGQVMNRGLWRYTRHPNYFGDFCVWWGLFLIACATPYGVFTVLSPLLMSFLLLRVSGVSLLEKTITKRRPEYAEYVARTSAFFPWPPKAERAQPST